jgi:hypothetical protein
MLMFNGLSFKKVMGDFRLFVDGIDVDTGKEFSAFWRRAGLHWAIVGFLMILLGALIYVIVFVILDTSLNRLGSMTGANWLIGVGVFYIIMAVILFVRYRRPRAYPSATVDNQPFRTV